MNRVSKALLCLGVFLAGAGEAATLRYHYDFTKQWQNNQWKGDWHRVTGYPLVPRVTAKILLPYGQTVEKFELALQTHGDLKPGLDFPVTPFPKPLCDGISFPEPAYPKFLPSQPYPADHSGKATLLRKHGYLIAQIPLFPVRYLPDTHEGIAIGQGDLVIETKADAVSPLYRGRLDDRAEVLAMIDGTDQLATYPLKTETRAADYLVIAPEELLADTDATGSLNALLAEKKARGVTSVTHSLEDIDSNFDGRDSQEKIRNAIKDHYTKDGIKYVLLVGNGYSSNPTRKLTVHMSEGTIYSDFYYGCLDGDYDANGNGKFGEPNDGVNGGDVDLACEVAVGRAPASGTEDVHAFVKKSLRMQAVKKDDARVWKTLILAEELDSSTLGSKIVDQLATGGQAGALETQGYPDKTEFNKMYESHSQHFSGGDVTSALTDGNFYTVNHLGHANETYDMRFSINDVGNVNNTEPFFGITQGCHPGNLKGKNWASAMVNSDAGGPAALVANSNYGYYNGQGSIDGPSNHYHLAFYDAVFRDGLRGLGKAHFKAKEKLIPEVTSDTIMRWVVYETNLFGDPELEFKF